MITEKILEILQSGVETTIEILDVMTSDRSTSYAKMRRSLKYGPKRYFKTDWAFEYKQRQKFYKLLYKLKKEGFIKQSKRENKRSFWKITKQGLKKLLDIKKNSPYSFPILKQKIKLQKETSFKIVTFDVPEKERAKRAWLREVLTHLEYSMLQKSVWVGKNRLPELFLESLRQKKLLECVHILKVYRSGTIEKII